MKCLWDFWLKPVIQFQVLFSFQFLISWTNLGTTYHQQSSYQAKRGKCTRKLCRQQFLKEQDNIFYQHNQGVKELWIEQKKI